MKDSAVVAMVSMVCLTVLESVAVASHCDGQYLLPLAGLIATLGGITGTTALVDALRSK